MLREATGEIELNDALDSFGQFWNATRCRHRRFTASLSNLKKVSQGEAKPGKAARLQQFPP
jgi:hypothetical protein